MSDVVSVTAHKRAVILVAENGIANARSIAGFDKFSGRWNGHAGGANAGLVMPIVKDNDAGREGFRLAGREMTKEQLVATSL